MWYVSNLTTIFFCVSQIRVSKVLLVFFLIFSSLHGITLRGSKHDRKKVKWDEKEKRVPVEDNYLEVFSKQDDAKHDHFGMIEKRALRCGYKEIVEDFKNANGKEIRKMLCKCAGMSCKVSSPTMICRKCKPYDKQQS